MMARKTLSPVIEKKFELGFHGNLPSAFKVIV